MSIEMEMNMVRAKPKPPVGLVRRIKKRKKSSRQLIEKQLDILLREIVLLRDIHCVCPPPAKGHYGALQAGHLITRGKHSIRWDLYNVHVQCQSCNARHEFFSHYYTNWFLSRFGVDNYSRLCQDGEEVKKLQTYELEELLEQLKWVRRRQLADKDFKPYFSQKDILSGAWAK